ncbi:MAG: VanZ family protein [Bacteroidia bacterium]|nr:VanZ family protein [Bacteroidia bacterium]
MFFKPMKWAMLWALFILILCGIPGRDIPHIHFLELLSFDKVVHAGIFFVLFILTAIGLELQTKYSFNNNVSKLYAAAFCIVYGASTEIMQGIIFTERSADVFDFIANTTGCFIAFYFYKKLRSIFIKLF